MDTYKLYLHVSILKFQIYATLYFWFVFNKIEQIFVLINLHLKLKGKISFVRVLNLYKTKNIHKNGSTVNLEIKLLYCVYVNERKCLQIELFTI